MKRRKYNYRFVRSGRFYKLELLEKKKITLLEKDIMDFCFVGPYIVYKRYSSYAWCMRDRNDGKVVYLGYYLSNLGFFSEYNRSSLRALHSVYYNRCYGILIRFFNTKGDFFIERYNRIGESHQLIVCYNAGDTCDVYYKRYIGRDNNFVCLEKYHAQGGYLLEDKYWNCKIRYVTEKQSWEIVDEKEYSWYQKLWRIIMKALC